MSNRPLLLGCRRDPDDTFRFAALASRTVALGDRPIELVTDDIAGLCARAERGELDAAVLPLPFQAAHAADWRYLESGFSAGDGWGPLVVANRVFIEFEIDENTTIHVPTRYASEALVLRLYSKACRIVEWPSEDMLKAIVDHRIETGVVSDQGSVSYGHFGVFKIEDLGEWWKFESKGLPLVTTGVAVRRSLGDDVARQVQRAVKASILWGVEHRDQALDAARRDARGVNDWILDKFVSLYVTPRSLALDESSLRGAQELLNRGKAAGLIEKTPEFDLVPDA
jgi:1,4-dihydroxy-6-naphthoate synthase